MKAISIIARLTFLEASRRKVLWAALLLGVLFLIVYGLGLHFARADIEASMQRQRGMSRMAVLELYNFLLLAGLYTVNFLGIAMSILTSVDTLSGEVASGTIQTLATKPIRRREIVAGKWLGLVVMLTLYLVLLAGGTIGVVYALTGYVAPNVGQGAILIWLNALLLLSISLWGGSFLSTLANGVVAFGLFGVAFVGGWVEHVGAFLDNRVAIHIGVACSLIMPSEALWRRAAYLMQSPLVASMGVSPFTSTSVPNSLMVWYAVLYMAAMLALAIRQFGRRDL
jgi:Cu-processing system permease protein